jgi:hypothetical protein
MGARRVRSITFILTCAVVLGSSWSRVTFAAATATTKTSRLDNGCVRIEIDVNPGGAAVKDVHLCVAKTQHTETKETAKGDPKNANYKDATAGGVLPAGWTYNGVTEKAEANPPGSSTWCLSWTSGPAPGGGAAAALGAPTTFKVDYCGDKDIEKASRENLFLTTSGNKTPNPGAGGDVVNGAGNKGEKGHGPAGIFATALPRPPGEQQPKQEDKK